MKIKKLTFVFLSVLFVITSLFVNKIHLNNVSASNNSAEIVMDVKTNRVLYSQNENEKKYMASTTKILTAIVVIENCNTEETVCVTKDTVGIEGSSIYLEEGEKLIVKELLYGLMLRSGNDCAETLAVHCSGSVEKFAILMNETARKIGANNSNFVNPHGLHDDNHYTTAYDLALISCYSMKNETFREIVGKKSVIIPHITRNTNRKLINKNKLLSNVEGATGIKTGYTKKAGRCLVGSVKKGDFELVAVVLNCPPMFERVANLIESCFNTFKQVKLVESDNILGFVKTKDNDERCALILKDDIILPLSDKELNNLKIEYEYNEIIDKPQENSKEIGFVKIYADNNLIFSEKIYTILLLK